MRVVSEVCHSLESVVRRNSGSFSPALRRSIRIGLLFSFALGSMYTSDARATYQFDPIDVSPYYYEPPAIDRGSLWDWSGQYDDNPLNDWEGVSTGDLNYADSAACHAIRDDGPKQCSASDVQRANGQNTTAGSLDVSVFTGLGLLDFAASESGFFTMSPAGQALLGHIALYVDLLSGIDESTGDSARYIRDLNQAFVSDVLGDCAGIGIFAWMATIDCVNGARMVSNELGLSTSWLGSLLSALGFNGISVGTGPVSAGFGVGENSMEKLRGEIARRNACATMHEALDRNGCL